MEVRPKMKRQRDERNTFMMANHATANKDSGDSSVIAAGPPIEFLLALFAGKDIILTRPIETWTDPDGKKQERIIWKEIWHHKANHYTDASVWRQLLGLSERERANIFLSVCPRYGGEGCFDLRWQVRTVRTLWSDIDGCCPSEATKRIKAAKLPLPSITNCSGTGTHAYWILGEAYLIDDVADPPPVLTEWIDRGEGMRKLKRKYIKGPKKADRIYLYLPDKKGGDSGRHNPECPWGDISPKAQHIEDVLSGIAGKIGGDHVMNLDRLLRMPNTLNRKNQRNGHPPLPCEVVEISDRRYTLADFEHLATEAPQRVRREAVARMRLPSIRKLTPRKDDSLNGLINACNAAPVGERSERDWNLVCWAVEHGVNRETLWEQVQNIGKFAEAGRRYFDLCIEKAELHTREVVYEKIQLRTKKPSSNGTAHPYSAASGSNGVPPTPPGDGGGDDGNEEGGAENNAVPGETLTDPHRLARAWLGRCATHKQFGDAAAYYRMQYWLWEKTRWRAGPDHEMKARVNRFVRETIAEDYLTMAGADQPLPAVTRELVSNVLAAIEGQVLVPQDVEMPCWRGNDNPGRRNWIECQNGILDVDALLAGADQVMRPHTPLWFSPTCLPYEFNPDADCPKWTAFLTRNLADDPGKARLLQQFAGYLVLPDTTQQRAMAMIGEGANGKSVVCEALTGMLGGDNVSTEPLELFADKFRLVNTLGKLANITAEVGELDKVAEGQLKAFIVGDPMSFEMKFKPAFTARPTARLLIATNNAPRFSDKSDGIWRRLILMPFTIQIPEGDRIAGMDKREWWERAGELPGILNWALGGLADLHKEGRFTIPQSCCTAADELRLESNPARMFLTEHYEAGTGFVFKALIYQHYKDWCRDRNYHALADRGFGKEVRRAFKVVKDGKAVNVATGTRENTYDGVEPRQSG
jgi:P4 family phage/plasmid primase-like protien